MNIKKIEQGKICHYCRQEFNGTEEGLIQTLPNGEESYYHLRCGTLFFIIQSYGTTKKALCYGM